LRDQIAEAINKVVVARKLEILFDKAGDVVMIYTHPRHDYSDYVLEELGLGENKEDKNTTSNAPPRTTGSKATGANLDAPKK
jgi:outer membrane protein